MTDRLVSWIRTVVPMAWSTLIAWLAARIGLPADIADQLTGFGGLLADLLAVAVLGVVYAMIRWLEPRLPRWLARILFGSAKTPTYRDVTA